MKPPRLVFVFLGLAALLAAFSPATPAHAQRQHAQPAAAAPRPADLSRNGAVILIRSVIIALDQANKTGNYTVLRDLGAPGFQVNTPARLAEIFANQRRDKLDLSGVVVIDPQLTALPQIEANGMMRMVGFFPSVPQQVNFQMLFAPVNGQWRLFGLSVSIGQSEPAAPMPAAPAPTPAPAPEAAATPAPAHAAPSPKPSPRRQTPPKPAARQDSKPEPAEPPE